MNEVQPDHSSSGSGLRCLETAGRLILHLPARPVRMATRFGGLSVFVFGFLLFVVYASEGWLPAAVAFGAIGAIILAIAFATMAGLYLTKTSVLLTTERVLLKTVLYGKERIQQSALSPHCRARQWYLPQRPGKRSNPEPQGIEIGPEPYDSEAGSDDWKDETKPRFGAGLARGEMDWVEWRINQFLDTLTEGAGTRQSLPRRLVAVPDDPVLRPEDTKVRVEQNPFESRIIFPNTFETRSFSGIGSVIFGLGLLAYPLFLALQWWNSKHGGGAAPSSALFVLAALTCGVLSLLGLASVLNGLTQLFGRRELRITPKTITYRAALLGVGLWRTLATADVVSVGLPQRPRRGRSESAMAPADGCVIRTAERELHYGRAVPAADTRWIIGEVARQIEGARSDGAVEAAQRQQRE